MATTPIAAQVPRDPKSSMKSTWRDDKSQWGPVHYLLDLLGMHPTDADREIPVHAKNSPIPGLPHASAHQWVLVHALWPLVLQQIYIWVTGKNLHPFYAFLFYNVVYIANGAHEVHMLRYMGHKYGFFDGDKHARDQIPDHSVNRVLRSLILTATFRPMFSIFLAYRSAQQPIHLHWLIPVEVGVYGIVLDFWFYWYHRVMHQFDSLWKYHRTHHLTKHPNPLLTLYADSEQEIFDIAGIPIMTWATMKLLGFPMGFYEWWICHNYVVFTELFGHSGVRIWAAATSTNNWFLGMFNAELQIEDHDLHHRQGWKKSMNYGKQTLLWDTIFNTRGPRYEALEHQVDWKNTAKIPVFWWDSPAALKKNGVNAATPEGAEVKAQ